MDGIIIVGIAISIVSGMTFVLQPASSQEKSTDIVSSHSPPDPFQIAVNGHTTPAIVATVQRGQTSQIDVFVSPNISGITGNVEVSSVFPICGTMNTLPGKCIPDGITTTLSNNVTTATHMLLTFSVSNDMPVGVYSFHVVASTILNVPYQSTPVHVGDSDSFSIQVV